MFKKNRVLLVTAVLLIISIGNYTRMPHQGTIRTVEFLSIFAIGALFAVLVMQARAFRRY